VVIFFSGYVLGKTIMDKLGESSISVVIPVYNEGQNISLLHEKLTSVMDRIGREYEVIFVDDGSYDDTLANLRSISQKSPQVRVLVLSRNFGQTTALSAGIDSSRGRIIIPMDGDLQNDPEDIVPLLEKIEEGYDVVSGWRQDRKDPFLKRRLPSILANRIISLIGGVHLHDYGCTLKAYRRDILKSIRLYGEMHRFIPIYAQWTGGRVSEIPVNHHARKFGSSNYGMSRVFKVVLDLMVVKFLLSYSQKPIYVFGGMGLLTILGSLLSGFYALYLKFVKGVSFILTPLPLLCVLLLTLGFLSILMGLLAEILTRTYYESQGKPTYQIKEVIP
jgi:glycosyltransferase involved in cell wall biosynthesis